MKRFALIMLSISVVAACGDDDDRGTGGDDAGTGGDAGMSGACTNASDLAALMRMDFGDAMDQSVPDIAAAEGTTCALAGMTGDALQMCTRDAIVEETGMAVSADCADCFAISVRCSAENCLTPCLGGSDSAECVACRCGDNTAMVNCIDAYTACSGIPSDVCAGM